MLMKVNSILNVKSTVSPPIFLDVFLTCLLAEGVHWSGVLQRVVAFLLSSVVILLHPDIVMVIQLAGKISFFYAKNMNW